MIYVRLHLCGAGDGDNSNEDGDHSNDSDEDEDTADGVPMWLKKLLSASSDQREEQTDRVANQFFQDIFDESGNVRSALACGRNIFD